MTTTHAIMGQFMKFEIKSRFTAQDIFTAGLEASFESKRDADLSDHYVRRAYLRGIPAIPNIHQTIYKAALQPGALNMETWHSCETTHCRAGLTVHLAGAAGKALEWCIGTPAAAALIYINSDLKLERVPNFYASNDDALADMKRLAEMTA